jgi:hypothetical protein
MNKTKCCENGPDHWPKFYQANQKTLMTNSLAYFVYLSVKNKALYNVNDWLLCNDIQIESFVVEIAERLIILPTCHSTNMPFPQLTLLTGLGHKFMEITKKLD